MLLQSVTDPRLAEVVFRTVQNASTGTLTITAGSIAIGSPVIAATNTASLPTTNFLPQTSAVSQNFVSRPATSTSLVNNLFLGILAKAPGSNVYLDREALGLAQIYGPYVGAAVQILTADQPVGECLIPESLQFLIGVTGPVTAASTGTAANVEVPAIGCLAVLMAAIASSSATSTGTGIVWLRCM